MEENLTTTAAFILKTDQQVTLFVLSSEIME
jgi:hypothetical protein